MTKVYSAMVVGAHPQIVEIEVVVQRGLSGLQLLGLPPDAARETRERVRAALESMGAVIPARRVVVNVSPSDRVRRARGTGNDFDFAIAAGVLLALRASEEVVGEKRRRMQRPASPGRAPGPRDAWFFGGELTLTGQLKPPSCSLAFEHVLLSRPDALGFMTNDASEFVNGAAGRIVSCAHLWDWVQWSRRPRALSDRCGKQSGSETQPHSTAPALPQDVHASRTRSPIEIGVPPRTGSLTGTLSMFGTVPQALVALAVAAAGRHHLLFMGEPGVGKTFAAQRLAELLPPLHDDEFVSLRLIDDSHTGRRRPVRSPHHSASSAALTGGASLLPGEFSLAHGGCLILDELAEFPRTTLEALREPLDLGCVRLARAQGSLAYPARFQLCATTNPCPCGHYFSTLIPCRCQPVAVQRYQQKISGPLLDRIELQVLLKNERTDSQKEADLFASIARECARNGTLNRLSERIVSFQRRSFGNSCEEGRHTLSRPAPPTSHPAEDRASTWSSWLGSYAERSAFSRRGQATLRAVAETFEALFGPELNGAPQEAIVTNILAYRSLQQLLTFGEPPVPQLNERDWRRVNRDSGLSSSERATLQTSPRDSMKTLAVER